MTPVDPKIPGLMSHIYAEHQEEYLPLPSNVDSNGTVVTLWRLSWREWFSVLFTRKIHITVLTFRHPLQPIRASTLRPEVAHGYVAV